MSSSHSIPEELIKIKAHEIWKKRQREGRDGTPENDWMEARQYLEKYRWKVFWWKFRKRFNKLEKLIVRRVRDGIKTLWRFLIFPFLLLWRFSTFPFWFFRTLQSFPFRLFRTLLSLFDNLLRTLQSLFFEPLRTLLGTLQSLFADPKSRDFALEIVKTFISALGLVATAIAGLGIFLTYIDSQEERKEAREELRLTQERLITDRFSKAVEQLGKDKITVRIGGIYALERIAKDSDKDFWTIMEVLTSYVRENSPITQELKDTKNKIRDLENQYFKGEIDYSVFLRREEELIESLKKVSIDVQAVLTVIGRREDPKPDREERIDLTNTNLVDANLEGANLEGANLAAALLVDANLAAALLVDANLTGALLNDAFLKGADLEGTQLIGVDLKGANLEGANLTDALLFRTQLIGANLKGARFIGARFIGANLNRNNLKDADLKGANLEGTQLIGVDLSGANLEGANLNNAFLFETNLKGTNLIDAQNLTSLQIEPSCNWEQAIYKKDNGENQKHIEKLKKDKLLLDPPILVDCSRWEK